MVSGKYPSTYKYTIILPFFKSGDKKLCHNYRPIALIFTISKIFEKCIEKGLMIILNKHSFFFIQSIWFSPKYVKHYSIVTTSHFIHNNWDKKFKILCIFLDFKKEFDSMNHELLINKLDFCGIRAKAFLCCKLN